MLRDTSSIMLEQIQYAIFQVHYLICIAIVHFDLLDIAHIVGLKAIVALILCLFL